MITAKPTRNVRHASTNRGSHHPKPIRAHGYDHKLPRRSCPPSGGEPAHAADGHHPPL